MRCFPRIASDRIRVDRGSALAFAPTLNEAPDATVVVMRKDLERLLTELLAQSARDGGVDIDAIGDAVTPLGVGPAEIEALMNAFEDRGGVVLSPEGGGNAERLKLVLQSARALTQSLGRKPSVAEIAAHSGLSVVHVRHALAVGSVMGR